MFEETRVEVAVRFLSLGTSKGILDEAVSGSLLTPFLDDDTRALHSVEGAAFLVVLAQTSPFTESLTIITSDQRDGRVGFSTESFNQVSVSGFIQLIGDHAQNSLVAVESLNRLTETTG